MEQRWGLPLIAWPSRLRPNYWDLVALPMVLGVIALVAWGGMAMSARYQIGQVLAISLDPWRLPEYALRTVLRMACGLVASLVFSLAYAALAAKSRRAEKILIPVLDILQSVPILGFLSITVTGFMALFPGRLLGVECAAIFAIFTSQAWNMTFSVYQSLRTVPSELIEAARRLGGDHRRRPDHHAARHRVVHRDSHCPARSYRDRLRGRRDVRRNPVVRSAAVPSTARLVAQVFARFLGRRR